MFEINNKNTKTSFWCFFIVNFKHISYLFTSASIANFEQVNLSWVVY